MRGKAKVIVINTSFRLAPWADVLYACDATWWRHYFSEAATKFVGGEMWTIAAQARDQFKIHWLYGASQAGVSDDNRHIHSGLNSGFQAIAIAHRWGAKKILLLGYDFQRTGGKGHWHTDHPRTLGNGGRFPEWVREMKSLADALKERGVEVINCTRKTALQCYQRSTIQEQL